MLVPVFRPHSVMYSSKNLSAQVTYEKCKFTMQVLRVFLAGSIKFRTLRSFPGDAGVEFRPTLRFPKTNSLSGVWFCRIPTFR